MWGLIIAANSSPSIYFCTPTFSFGTAYQATVQPYSSFTTLTYPGTPVGTTDIQDWATNAGVPSLKTIPAGVYSQHIVARNASGGNATLHAQFWEVSSTGVDIAMIGQSDETVQLTASSLGYVVQFVDANVYTLTNASSRINSRIFATVAGSPANILLYVGGSADTSFQIPGNVASPQPGSINCPDATGSTTVYTCPTPSPVPPTYSTGTLIAFTPQTTNTTTSPTLNVAALGAENLVDATGVAASLTIGQLVGGSTYLFEYDGTVLRLAGGGSGGGTGTVTHTGALTSNAVILGNGTADVKPGAVLPADATKFYNGAGAFTVPAGGGTAVACPENPISMTIGNTYTCTDNLGVATGKFLWCQDPNSTPVNAAVQVSWAGATVNTFTWVAAAIQTVNCYASLGGGGGGGGGSGLLPWNPVASTPPALSSWTQVNTGGNGTFADVRGGVFLDTVSGNNLKELVVASPGASGSAFTITGHLNGTCPTSSNDTEYGLIVNDATIHSVSFGCLADINGICAYQVLHSTSGVPAASAYQGGTNSTPDPTWLRIQYDGTNLKMFISATGADAVSWTQLFSEAASVELTGNPAAIGFFGYPSSGGTSCKVTLGYWLVTQP
jgi:hypothetical protein